jgi:hypothetical protein
MVAVLKPKLALKCRLGVTRSCVIYILLQGYLRIMKSRRMRWTRHLALMEEKRDVCRLQVGKPEGKRLLGKPRHRWMNNI